ncbi:SusD/RagB family nutrient-binding outer membrane lipoprotein [Capnocytophaga sp. G2]|uniref:SusD/RagB family nutrient-binding outer membrane lipoprotein n=1 Tax=Capnocytophaga sp. G2 TaxID=3110695 RepID=UPI002B46A4A2|nr:SusD/RagB family nutrient-binding outer membrane lipoprotein [Capnocytophaga sp. G2]MEB3005056.1 SusD/RagB family nutrient-binding outer membrane lipoprotein [Capnocytophaga sp. G2]
MKRILSIILSGAGLLLSTSCEKDFEQINTNPNKPKASLSYALFNGSNKRLMDYTRYSTTSGKLMRSWMQYTAQTAYTKESRFLYSDYSGDYIWRFCYQVAGDYKEIIELNMDPATKVKTALYGNNDNQIAASRILMGYVFSLLAETYGNVPYYSWHGKDNPKFQALQLEKYISPEYADQKDIYMDILEDLKEAVDQIKTTDADGRAIKNVFTAGDDLFRTPEKLKRFGNSLRLRIAMHLSRVRDTELKNKALETIREITVTNPAKYPVMQSNADTVELPYESNDTNPSPIYKNYFVDRRTDYSPSNTLVEILKGTRGASLGFGVDPRLQKYCAPKNTSLSVIKAGSYQETDDLTKYAGMPYGINESYSDSQFSSGRLVSLFASKILNPNYAEVFMEYSEVCFLLSEAPYALGGAWDDAKYKEGVRASMEKWGVDATKITAFVNRLPAATEETVMTQKYIALYMNPNEAWTEYRRTGYPNILIKNGDVNPLLENVTNAQTHEVVTTYTFTSLVSGVDFPQRLQYPLTYKNINLANFRKALKDMGMGDRDFIGQKLIFAKQ